MSGDVKLSDFVAETLAIISDGVRRAQDYSRKRDGVPIAPNSVDGIRMDIGDQLVRFSVSVEVNDDTNISGKGELGGALVSVVKGSLGGDVEKSRSKGSQHTIEFAVPMHFHLRWSATDGE